MTSLSSTVGAWMARWPKYLLGQSVSLVLVASALMTLMGPVAAKPLKVQLKWWHTASSSGLYAAKHRNYFADAGVSVELIAGGPKADPVDSVVTGAVHVGVANGATLVQAQAKGLPVVAIAAFYKTHRWYLSRYEKVVSGGRTI
jgi:ABC-type nitrate/sulfonate/bicarbonate transport system substrate-binding protein